MLEPNFLPAHSERNAPAAAPVSSAAHWLSQDDDLALGCECADPALQIERWGQEAPAFLRLGA
ncbi:MAG: hypothetical protein Q8Q73_01200 [Stagnimonas sp.]|nr:hypothetical protein [Stagnimonas sp.]